MLMAVIAALAAGNFLRINRVAGLLLIPYLAWLIFAAALITAQISGHESGRGDLAARLNGRRAMQSENKMFDDFVKMVNGFAGTMAGMGREAEILGAREDARMDGGQ